MTTPRETVDRAAENRGVVAFDNTGTLSDPVVEEVAVREDAPDEPIPEIPPDRPTALASVALDGYDAFDADEPLGAVVADHDLPVTLALSNVETTAERTREAVVADDAVPARSVTELVETLVERVSAEFSIDDPPVGVQLAVDLDAARVDRVFAYTTVPRAVAGEVVGRVRELGYEPHVVSGDATHVLGRVADEVAVPESNVHAYQSAEGKAAVLSEFREGGSDDVVMVGDYVNDRHAFEVADAAVLVCGDEGPEDALVERADVVVDGIEDVPDVL